LPPNKKMFFYCFSQNISVYEKNRSFFSVIPFHDHNNRPVRLSGPLLLRQEAVVKKQKNAIIMLCVLVSFSFCGIANAVQNALQPVYFLLLNKPNAATHTVTPSAGLNGTITPYSPQSVNHGATTQFTVTPEAGYTAFVGGTCGGSLAGTTYTTYIITANCTVEAIFFVPGSNDTGLTWGGNYPSGNNPDCTGETISAQDCSHGRDVTHNDPSDGHAGFSFTKISNSGAELSSSATLGSGANDWACTRDNVTGLIWEVKTDDGGLRDQNDTYSWYNTDPSTNGGAAGTDNSGRDTCNGYDAEKPATYCNTQAFVARVNTTGLCGYSDWRMPSVKELEGIVSCDRDWPAIDTTYFPNTLPFVFWSGSSHSFSPERAWDVSFEWGDSTFHYRYNDHFHVRLVR
jgi:hypothetical protein